MTMDRYKEVLWHLLKNFSVRVSPFPSFFNQYEQMLKVFWSYCMKYWWQIDSGTYTIIRFVKIEGLIKIYNFDLEVKGQCGIEVMNARNSCKCQIWYAYAKEQHRYGLDENLHRPIPKYPLWTLFVGDKIRFHKF